MPRPKNNERLLPMMPGTTTEIAQRAGISIRTVHNIIERLREEKMAYISGWRRTDGSGPLVRIFSAGEGVDAYCQLKPMSKKQIYRRFKAKSIKTGANDFKCAEKRAQYWAKKAVKTPNTWASSLFALAGVKMESRA
jgi:hypothetical protein